MVWQPKPWGRIYLFTKFNYSYDQNIFCLLVPGWNQEELYNQVSPSVCLCVCHGLFDKMVNGMLLLKIFCLQQAASKNFPPAAGCFWKFSACSGLLLKIFRLRRASSKNFPPAASSFWKFSACGRLLLKIFCLQWAACKNFPPAAAGCFWKFSVCSRLLLKIFRLWRATSENFPPAAGCF